MKWNTFNYNQTGYDFAHLDPYIFEYDLTEHHLVKKKLNIRVAFSHHCFTKGLKVDDNKRPVLDSCHPDLLFMQKPEDPREFCPDRYKMSFQIPQMINDFIKKRVLHTGKRNYLYMPDGSELYFDVTKVTNKKYPYDLNIYVRSHYVRTQGNPPNAGPIGFHILAANTYLNKPIKTSKKTIVSR